MFEIKVIGEFSAAHNLKGYIGRCEELHGHNWKVEVVVCGENLDRIGMLIDFKELKSQLNMILDGLDHHYLNRLSYFKRENPSSENIARYIYERLRSMMFSDGFLQRGKSCRVRSKTKNPNTSNLVLKSVSVWENVTSSATYIG